MLQLLLFYSAQKVHSLYTGMFAVHFSVLSFLRSVSEGQCVLAADSDLLSPFYQEIDKKLSCPGSRLCYVLSTSALF